MDLRGIVPHTPCLEVPPIMEHTGVRYVSRCSFSELKYRKVKIGIKKSLWFEMDDLGFSCRVEIPWWTDI